MVKKTLEEVESKFKLSQEQANLNQHENKKQVAMRDQKIEFLQMQLTETKEILEET